MWPRKELPAMQRSLAGRSEAAGLACAGSRKFGHDREARPRGAGKDELRDAVAGIDSDAIIGLVRFWRVAVPGRNETRTFVIRINEPDRVTEHEAVAMAVAGAGQNERAPIRIAKAERDTGRDQHRGVLWAQQQRRVNAGMQVETGGQFRAVMREAPARQPRIEDLQFDCKA